MKTVALEVLTIGKKSFTTEDLTIERGLFLNEEPPSLVVHSPDSDEITIIPIEVVKGALASGDDDVPISVPLGGLLRSLSNSERSKES